MSLQRKIFPGAFGRDFLTKTKTMDPVRPKNVATMDTASSNSHGKKKQNRDSKFRMLYDKTKGWAN